MCSCREKVIVKGFCHLVWVFFWALLWNKKVLFNLKMIYNLQPLTFILCVNRKTRAGRPALEAIRWAGGLGGTNLDEMLVDPLGEGFLLDSVPLIWWDRKEAGGGRLFTSSTSSMHAAASSNELWGQTLCRKKAMTRIKFIQRGRGIKPGRWIY